MRVKTTQANMISVNLLLIWRVKLKHGDVRSSTGAKKEKKKIPCFITQILFRVLYTNSTVEGKTVQ